MAANARLRSFRAEYRLHRANRAWRWVIETAESRLAEDGTSLGLVGSVLRISERREAEEH